MLEKLAIGTDIVELSRIKQIITAKGQRFLSHIFTENEQSICNAKVSPHIHYGGKFAAKEAVKFVNHGMIVGLGTGSTAAIAIDLKTRCQDETPCVSCSVLDLKIPSLIRTLLLSVLQKLMWTTVLTVHLQRLTLKEQ